MLPRPDVALLGVRYRRIPILTIGRDIYLDTRLILKKLETLPIYPNHPKLGASTASPTPENQALERLLSTLTVESGPFVWAVSLLPGHLPLFQDKAMVQDRSSFFPGAKLAAPTPAARAEAVANMRGVFELLETTVLADGREWVLPGTTHPSLADIEAVWVFHWLRRVPGALRSEEGLSKEQFPRVFAWIKRFEGVIEGLARKNGEKDATLKGQDAARMVVEAAYAEKGEGTGSWEVQKGEPVAVALGLKEGDRVVLYPTDTGSSHKDIGRLLGLNGDEVIIETKAGLPGEPAVRVHAPRVGFRIVREDQASHL